ncbi:MAG: hypothetical protein ACFBRM_03590 [Pikeienuella sp.]
MPRKSQKRFTIPKAEEMRAETGVTASALAGASGVTTATAEGILKGRRYSRSVCLRIVKGLTRLGHKNALPDQIEEHLPAAQER